MRSPDNTHNKLPWLKKVIFACSVPTVIFVSLSLILDVPGIPYNVKELFLDKVPLFHYTAFTMCIVWVGLSAPFSGEAFIRSKFSWLSLPGTMCLTGIITLLLLKLSVTRESISDITGSTNIYRFVMNKGAWGDFGIGLFNQIGSPDLISGVERVVRFIALTGPLFIFLTLQSAAVKSGPENRKTIAAGAIYALPWLMVCKFIAFDHASTDNLYELIARDGPWGIGGGACLYILLFLVSLNSTLLAHMNFAFSRKTLLTLIFTAIALPAGWWLLKNGLVTGFTKYGLTYSGVDFILGPDRRNLLPEQVLMTRWFVVQLSGTLILAHSQKTALILLPFLKRRISR